MSLAEAGWHYGKMNQASLVFEISRKKDLVIGKE
jgi:hypothetical protein